MYRLNSQAKEKRRNVIWVGFLPTKSLQRASEREGRRRLRLRSGGRLGSHSFESESKERDVESEEERVETAASNSIVASQKQRFSFLNAKRQIETPLFLDFFVLDFINNNKEQPLPPFQNAGGKHRQL